MWAVKLFCSLVCVLILVVLTCEDGWRNIGARRAVLVFFVVVVEVRSKGPTGIAVKMIDA